MRFALLLPGLLLPSLAAAQFGLPPKISGAGSYLPRGSAKVVANEISFTPYATEITVKSAAEKTTYTPTQISQFNIAKRKFVAINNIPLTEKQRVIPKHVFAEQLDSGQLILHGLYALYYTGYGYNRVSSQLAKFYLLRFSTDSVYIAIPTDQMGSKTHIQENLAPYLATRPDLRQLLQTKGPTSVITDNLLAIIHAFNTGQPYSLPLTHYELVKQQLAAKRAQKAKLSALPTDSTRR